jgi:hypothetical protein
MTTPVPVGLSKSACFFSLNAFIIWFAKQIWLGYGENGKQRDTPLTTISTGAIGATGGVGGVAARRCPLNDMKAVWGIHAVVGGHSSDSTGA